MLTPRGQSGGRSAASAPLGGVVRSAACVRRPAGCRPRRARRAARGGVLRPTEPGGSRCARDWSGQDRKGRAARWRPRARGRLSRRGAGPRGRRRRAARTPAGRHRSARRSRPRAAFASAAAPKPPRWSKNGGPENAKTAATHRPITIETQRSTVRAPVRPHADQEKAEQARGEQREGRAARAEHDPSRTQRRADPADQAPRTLVADGQRRAQDRSGQQERGVGVPPVERADHRPGRDPRLPTRAGTPGRTAPARQAGSHRGAARAVSASRRTPRRRAPPAQTGRIRRSRLRRTSRLGPPST